MGKQVLITGGSGMIGSVLTQKLLLKGYEVAHLTRKKTIINHVKTFLWDPDKSTMEEEALQNTSYIIHLAGAGVFDKAWTNAYKEEIISSRVNSASFLLKKIKEGDEVIEAFISASGIAYYGADTKDLPITENSSEGPGFLSEVVKAWEKAADLYLKNNIRTVKLRTGIVLGKEGGALSQIAQPIRYGIGSPLGTGKQYIPWIHIDDLCEMYIHSLENKSIEGVYNAVSPFPVTNEEFTKECARILKKPIFFPNVPSFILKIYLGAERADYILGGNRIITPKIEKEGFKYRYPLVFPALTNLLFS